MWKKYCDRCREEIDSKAETYKLDKALYGEFMTINAGNVGEYCEKCIKEFLDGKS